MKKAKVSIADVQELDEIVVVGGRLSAVENLMIGSEKFKPQILKNIPSALGESDIMKIVLTLPGVTSVGEASSGYNVRGGATDQNLILFNGGTVFNPSHLFGLFTSFNSDAVDNVELFKSSIPVEYGGRISSVLNVTSKEANMQKFTGSASIGLLTSKANLEIPIVKDHVSLLLNGRTTYSDWILKQLPEDSGYRDGKANFFDFGGVLTWKLNNMHRLKLYGYWSKDKFSFYNIKPQSGWQAAAGIYHETTDKKYEFSAEVYYKHISDYLNYRSSAVLLMNHHLETDVIFTRRSP